MGGLLSAGGSCGRAPSARHLGTGDATHLTVQHSTPGRLFSFEIILDFPKRCRSSTESSVVWGVSGGVFEVSGKKRLGF